MRMQRSLAALVLALSLLPQLAAAQSREAMQQLGEAMRISEIIDIMRQEGAKSANEIAINFDIVPTPRYQQAVEDIYDADRMRRTVMRGMGERLSDAEATRATEFFQDGLGARILDLELSARIAFMDESIEAQSNEFAATLQDADPRRYGLITDYIEINDLLESNVVGALNSNFAFMVGLEEGGAFPQPMGQGELLNQVYAQEPDIRDDTEEWLYSYLSLAYQPLSDDELKQYVEFSQTDHGQALNAALFAGFDAMFEEISRALGLTVGQMSGAQEL